MKCPLCSSYSAPIENISVSLLCKLWERQGINVQNILRGVVLSRCTCRNCGLSFYYPFVSGDNNFYGQLSDKDWYYKHDGKSEYEFSAKRILPGEKVIDVGCGIGEFCNYLASDIEFIGVELSTRSVQIAEDLGRNVHKFDITNAPQSMLGAYDVVTCFQVLEHIPEINKFFSSLVGLCRPGGKIIIAVPNNDGFLGDGTNITLNLPPHHILLWGKQSILYLANKYELRVVEYVEEDLSVVHAKLFFSIVIQAYINRVLCVRSKTIEGGLFYILKKKFSALLALVLLRTIGVPRVKGHSTIVVLEKPASTSTTFMKK